MTSAFYVYILRCADGSYYVGHTDDVRSRITTHNDGRGAAWTARRRPVKLVYCEPCADEKQAVVRERQIKGWSGAKKKALVAGDLAALRRLSRSTATATAAGK